LGEKSVVVSTSGVFRVLRHFAYPNPFSEGVEVFYQVTEAVREARLKIYTVSGRRVRTLMQGHPEADLNRITWDGRDGDGDRVANGVYLYRLELAGPDGKRTTHEGKIARVVGHVDG
jgi:flagellar hook assembly protein FlgD